MNIKKDFQTYFVSAIKQYFDFKGRTSKKAYWMFVLYSMIIGWIVIALDNILGTEEIEFITIWGIHYGMFYNFYSLMLIIPGFAIAVRRLHDVGIEGKKIWIVFIPIYGIIWLVLQLIKEGQPRANEYGPVPPDEPRVEGHPYAPSGEEKPKEEFNISVIRKEAEEEIKKQEKPKPKVKVEKIDRTVKWGRDRGAKDFRPPSDRKRKK